MDTVVSDFTLNKIKLPDSYYNLDSDFFVNAFDVMCDRYSFDSYRYSVLEFDKFGFPFYVVVVVFFDFGFLPIRNCFYGYRNSPDFYEFISSNPCIDPGIASLIDSAFSSLESQAILDRRG